MLIIRPEQMAVFQPVAEAAFVRRVVEYLRRKHGDVIVRLVSGTTTLKEIPDETLREMAGYGLTRAQGYGMKSEADLAGFICLMFKVAPNFDSHPLIQHALNDPAPAPDSRLNRLWEHTSDENWTAAKRQYDAAAWGLKSSGEI
jgi:hypothetical protein